MKFDRKPGALLEIFGDFWLGMAGAGARGFAYMTEERRLEKAKKEQKRDLFAIASEAAVKTFEDAKATADQTKKDLEKKK